MEKIPGANIHTHGETQRESQNQFRETLQRCSLEKTPEEIEAISFIFSYIKELCGDLLDDTHILSPDNIYLLNADDYKKLAKENEEGLATFDYTVGAVLCNVDTLRDLVPLGIKIFHECIHAIARTEYSKEAGSRLKRMGIEVITETKKEDAGGFHEALVAYFEKKFAIHMRASEEWQQEFNELASEENEPILNHVQDTMGIPKDEIVWIEHDTGFIHSLSYRLHRDVFEYVCEEIAKNTGQSEQEVAKRFLGAHVRDNLLAIGREIETVFGKGSFRLLNEMTTNEQSAIETLQELKRRRKP